MMLFTDEQVANLAPDGGSLKAGRELANERKWVTLAQNERVTWGEVQGSGKNPYQTQVDLVSIAFKCSCPSRKFPCKHGLGLLFLLAKNQNLFSKHATEPLWVADWIEKRAAKIATTPPESDPVAAEINDQKEAEKKAKSKAKTTDLRLQKVAAGVAEMDLLLRDWVRGGLLALSEKDGQYFEKIAARMVDAQAVGLANAAKEFAKIGFFDNQNARQSAFLAQIAQTFLLTESYKNIEKIAQTDASLLANDVRSFIGFSQKSKEFAAQTDADRVRDNWFVVEKTIEQEDDLTLQKQWLIGANSKKFALILDFAYKKQPLPMPFTLRNWVDLEVVFYPASVPIRAVVTQQFDRPTQPPNTLSMLQDWNESQVDFAQKIQMLPFLDELPQLVQQLRLVSDGKKWLLQDQNRLAMPLSPNLTEQSLLQLLAQSGGGVAHFAILRNHETVLPLYVLGMAK